MVQQTEVSGGLPSDLVKRFNGLPDEADTQIALTKTDIELLVNSLGKFHQSYADFLNWHFVTHGQPSDLTEKTEKNAKDSFQLFVELAANLMDRFVEASDHE